MAAGSTSAGTAAPASAPPLLSLPLLTAEDVLGERLAAAVEGTPEGGVEAFLAANVAGSSTLRRAVLKALAVSLSAAGMGWRPRARLLRALMRKLTRDWNTAAYAAVVLAGFTGLQGWDVYRAKVCEPCPLCRATPPGTLAALTCSTSLTLAVTSTGCTFWCSAA